MVKVKTARGGARGKLRAHFLANIGRIMDSEELRSVADNQSEWARRVRELRTEEGYLILTHNDLSELKPGQYLLNTPKPARPLTEQSQKKPAPMCLTVMALLAKCAVPSQENRIHTTRLGKPDYTSDTLSTRAKAGLMSLQISAPFALSATKALKMPC